MEFFVALIRTANFVADIFVTIAAIFGLLTLAAHLTIKWIKNEGTGRGLFLGIIFLLFEAVVAGATIYIPNLASSLVKEGIPAGALRWELLSLIIPVLIYLYTKKESGKRGLYTAFGHMLILLYGWHVGEWIGILSVSIPIFAIFYWLIDKLAIILLPASNPDDKNENHQKFKFLSLYIWGLQYPVWVIAENAGRELEKRINGDCFKDFGQPGAVWTRPHQVVGISTGVEFVDVKGPGLVFTNIYERPVAVVDLRTQLRSSEINTVLNDGTQIKAILFAAFAIDHSDWKKQDKEKRHAAWRTGPILLPHETRVDRENRSYPYSRERVHAALSTIGVTATGANDNFDASKKPPIYWDSWVLGQLEQAAREVLSQRNMDNIWVPKDDRPGHSALDEVSEQIVNMMAPRLQNYGIQLFSARVIKFILAENSEIATQQFETWKTVWEQRKATKKATGDAEYDRLLKEAKAQTRSALLQSVIGSLNLIGNPKIAKQVVALNYLDKLEKFLQQHQSSPEGEKVRTQVDTIKQEMVLNKKENKRENIEDEENRS